ncbi:MAG: hypothetical protein GX250_03105 [Clostridiales bacterium]|nr:hypothetical protein [Clostridiales bacterium]
MPWCHNCESEYQDGTMICPECGGELFEEMPPSMMEPAKASWRLGFKRTDSSPEWPLDSDGRRISSAFLANIAGTQVDYEMALSVLRAFNIPYVCDFPGAGPFVKILIGFSGAGMNIYVPETMLEDARNVLFSSSEDGN